MLNYYYKIEQLANWETDGLENVIQNLLNVAVSSYWASMFNIQPEASASTPATAEVKPETQEHSTSTRDTSSLQRLVAMTRKEVQQGYIPFSSRALWHNEIQKYHPEIECCDNARIAHKATCGDFSALPEDMLLIVQELSEPETTAHVEPKTAVVDIKPKSQTEQPSETKPSAPVQETKPARKLPMPKSRRQVYDFSKCADADTLRKVLNAGSIDIVKAIAESYREFQPRTDRKTMTKKDYVTAIVRLYFPDYQPTKKAPVQGTQQVNYPFVPGKIYVKKLYNNTRKIELVKIIRRNGDYITVQEVSYPELVPMFKTQRVRLYRDRFLTHEGFLLNSHDITDFNHTPQDCVYSHPDYVYNPEYSDYYQYYKPETPQPSKPIINSDEVNELLSIHAVSSVNLSIYDSVSPLPLSL